LTPSDDFRFPRPKRLTKDPRLGKPAKASDGFTGIVESILRYPDGFEHIQIRNPQTGIGRGGLTPDQVTIDL